jgi:hypothetical protein
VHEELDDTVQFPPRTAVETTDDGGGLEPDLENTAVRPIEDFELIDYSDSDSGRSWPTVEIAIPEFDQAPPESFFRFRIGGATYWIDAVTYVGRRPSSPRIMYGQMPRLIRVASPKQEVSGTHLELRQLGSSVVATDMRSTNGSIVSAPGAGPFKLRQGESVVVAPGTLLDIGDGNILEILLMARHEPAPVEPVDPPE